MTKLLMGSFLIAHGLVHAAVWATPKGEGAKPFDPSHSWLLEAFGIASDSARTLSMVLATAAAAGFVSAGVALFAGSDWWRVIAIVTAIESLPLFLLFFSPWPTLGAALEVAILYALVVSHWPAEAVVGV